MKQLNGEEPPPPPAMCEGLPVTSPPEPQLPSRTSIKMTITIIALIATASLATWQHFRPKKFWGQHAKITSANYIPLPNDLGQGIESGYGIEISPINNLPPGLKNIADELRQNRINFQNNETRLEQWRHNESFEIKAYAEMRKAGRPPSDPACLRTVNRRYYLKEIVARSSAIKKGLTEKNQTLLNFYDETQMRQLTPEAVGNRVKELNDRLSAAMQIDFNQIDQTIKILEEGNYQISTKDWAIGDTDQFMDFGPKPALSIQDETSGPLSSAKP
ncbi:MAG: hypothetical protein WC610_00065 [Patescibacteria group bacterium]